MESASSVLEPVAIFLCSPQLQQRKDWRKDWESCFDLKAAAVWSAITKSKANGGALKVARKLLISLAQNCAPEIKDQTQSQKAELTVNLKPDQKQNQKAAGDIAAAEEELGKLPASTLEVIDAVYVVVGVLHDLKDKCGTGSPDREKVDAAYADAHRQDAMADVVKIGNQVPLSLLMDTVHNLESAIKKAMDTVKRDTTNEALIKSIENFKLGFDKSSFRGVVDIFCWYFSPLYTETPRAGSENLLLNDKGNLLESLHSSLVNGSHGGGGTPGRQMAQSAPKAAQLARTGLGFGAAGDGRVRVQFSNLTLKLPATVFDYKLETVVGNLLEWERSQRRQGERPVTRYFLLLWELVKDDGDVRVLRNAGVLRERWRKKGEVVGFLRRMEGFASHASAYSPVDDGMKKARAAYEERMKSFMVRNRTAVVWVSSAALASLLITAVLAAKRRR